MFALNCVFVYGVNVYVDIVLHCSYPKSDCVARVPDVDGPVPDACGWLVSSVPDAEGSVPDS